MLQTSTTWPPDWLTMTPTVGTVQTSKGQGKAAEPVSIMRLCGLRVMWWDGSQGLGLANDVIFSHVCIGCLVSCCLQHVLEGGCPSHCIGRHHCILLGSQLPLAPCAAKLLHQPANQHLATCCAAKLLKQPACKPASCYVLCCQTARPACMQTSILLCVVLPNCSTSLHANQHLATCRALQYCSPLQHANHLATCSPLLAGYSVHISFHALAPASSLWLRPCTAASTVGSAPV